MEDKIIISVESHRIKRTMEASNQIDVYEFTEIIFDLMRATGYNENNIIEGFKQIIKQQEQ